MRLYSVPTITKGRHMEKLCLISHRIGRDKISDFTMNFAKRYLLGYTQSFARTYLTPSQCRTIMVPKVYFNMDTMSWAPEEYYLPWHHDDFVLLTPKSMLTRDDTFINLPDMLHSLEQIAPSIPDAALRFELDAYFKNVLAKKKKELSQTEKEKAATDLIKQYGSLPVSEQFLN